MIRGMFFNNVLNYVQTHNLLHTNIYKVIDMIIEDANEEHITPEELLAKHYY